MSCVCIQWCFRQSVNKAIVLQMTITCLIQRIQSDPQKLQKDLDELTYIENMTGKCPLTKRIDLYLD